MKTPNTTTITRESISEAILLVRDTGKTNMFDLGSVSVLAKQLGFKGEAAYLKTPEGRGAYGDFIMRKDASKFPETLEIKV